MNGRRHPIGVARKTPRTTYHVDLVERLPSGRIEISLWDEPAGRPPRKTSQVFNIRLDPASDLAALIVQARRLADDLGLVVAQNGASTADDRGRS